MGDIISGGSRFCQKLHEIERIWTPGGHASKILLCRSATGYASYWNAFWLANACILSKFYSSVQYPVADLGGVPPVCAPLRPKLFSISCSFSQNLAKLYVGTPPRGLAPPPTGNPGSAPGIDYARKIMLLFLDTTTNTSRMVTNYIVKQSFI